MALNYTRLATTAERLIEENGRSVTLLKGGEVVSDPAKPWRDDSTTGDLSLTVIGAIVNYDYDEIDGDLIKRGDKRLLIAQNSVSANEIETFDRVLDGGVDWKIQDTKVWEPGDTRIFYDIQLRK